LYLLNEKIIRLKSRKYINMKLEQLKNIIQSSHIGFLFGSGLSQPYLSTLGSIENLLTESAIIENSDARKLVQLSLYVKYLKGVMFPCLEILASKSPDYNKVISNYECFLKIWNEIIARRKDSLLDKQVNIFTTNIDNLVEISAESQGVEFNDGFKGHRTPVYREDSFSNIVSKVSPLYQNSAMIPTFNFMKIHGSINWIQGKENTVNYDSTLQQLQHLKALCDSLNQTAIFSSYSKETTLCEIQKFVEDHLLLDDIDSNVDEFIDEYNKLIMINPRKSKFRETVIDLHFYELMRLYSNNLECASTLLMVAGFSFADEHIAKITVRAANSNPTLIVLIFAYDKDAEEAISNNLTKAGPVNNNNIKILTPEIFRSCQDQEFAKEKLNDLKVFDFESINKYVFAYILNLINK
jgi:hypothetical protein